jgi:hypothetical protein
MTTKKELFIERFNGYLRERPLEKSESENSTGHEDDLGTQGLPINEIKEFIIEAE